MKLNYNEYKKNIEQLKSYYQQQEKQLSELAGIQFNNYVNFKKQNLINASFNNTRGRALFTLLKLPIIAYQHKKLIRNEINYFHVGKLCLIKITNEKLIICEPLFYDKESNLFFTRPVNINNYTLSKNRKNYIYDINFELLENRLAFIYSNYTTNYIQPPLFVSEKYLPLELIKLNSGDIFAVPLTQSVIDLTNSSPNINYYWSINENGKYIFYENKKDNEIITLGKTIFISADCVWLYYNPLV